MQVRWRSTLFNVTALVTGQLWIDTTEKGFFSDFEKDMLPVSKSKFFFSNHMRVDGGEKQTDKNNTLIGECSTR